MHELLIAKQIIEKVEKAKKVDKNHYKNYQNGEITSITVEVGELASIPLSELNRTLAELRPEWKIITIRKNATVKCSCGFKGKPRILEKAHGLTLFACPECGYVPEILDGKEVILKNIILKDVVLKDIILKNDMFSSQSLQS